MKATITIQFSSTGLEIIGGLDQKMDDSQEAMLLATLVTKMGTAAENYMSQMQEFSERYSKATTDEEREALVAEYTEGSEGEHTVHRVNGSLDSKLRGTSNDDSDDDKVPPLLH